MTSILPSNVGGVLSLRSALMISSSENLVVAPDGMA